MKLFSVILVAAGQSTRFGAIATAEKKPFVVVNQRPLWWYSAKVFRQFPQVQQLIVVLAAEDQVFFRQQFSDLIQELAIEIVIGGSERSDSVNNGLNAVDLTSDYVAIHDAARPCIDRALVDRVFQMGQESGAAIPAIPIASTIKRSADGIHIDATVDRQQLYLAQTPQVFHRKIIQRLYQQKDESPTTDEAQLAERFDVPVRLVAGTPWNQKVTTAEDLIWVESCLALLKAQHPRP